MKDWLSKWFENMMFFAYPDYMILDAASYLNSNHIQKFPKIYNKNYSLSTKPLHLIVRFWGFWAEMCTQIVRKTKEEDKSWAM